MSNNFDEVLGALDAWVDQIDLTHARAPTGKQMATDVLDCYAAGIIDRSLGRQMDPMQAIWPDNAESYKKLPEKKGKPISVLTGEMMSEVQVKGERSIEPHMATMTHGTNEFAKAKAQWFTCGSIPRDGMQPSGAENQPPRPFYELDDQIRTDAYGLIVDAVGRHITDWNGGIGG